MRRSIPALTLLSAVLASAVISLSGAAVAEIGPAAGAAAGSATEPTLVPVTATTCPRTPEPGEVTCLARAVSVGDAAVGRSRSEAAPRTGAAVPLVARNKSDSYTPSDLASLYRIPGNLKPTDTVAIIDVGSDPNTEAQMSYYRSYFGLPACTRVNGCFREVGHDGGGSLPATDSDWVVETALDVQAVSAICPTCSILLVDANSASILDMAKATLTATRLGATYVSLSYGSAESIATTSLRSTYYNNPNVTYVAAAGDSGYGGGALFPASAPNIVAAGGTSVRLVNGTWQQSAWSGAGSGCSSQHAMSAPQSSASLAPVCNGRRVVSDMSALADPGTGMLFYRGGSWWNAGGTSLATPILTALYALAGNHTAPLSIYGSASALTDVTSGSTGTCSPAQLCSAGPGWDGPTGLGTPSGLEALAVGGSLPTYISGTASTLSGGSGYPAKLAYHLADSATGAAVPGALVLLQRRLPGGGFEDIRIGSTTAAGTVVFTDAPRKPATYQVVFQGDTEHDPVTSNALSLGKFEPKVRLKRLAGRFRAKVSAPWGPALRSETVKLQQRSGRYWISVRKLRTDKHGVVVARLARGHTYRLQYGGGSWRLGHTAAFRSR